MVERRIVANTRTFGRKIGRVGKGLGVLTATLCSTALAGALIWQGWIYGEQGAKEVDKWDSTRKVNNAVSDMDYVEAIEGLEEIKAGFEGDFSELEELVAGIHPSQIYEQAKSSEDSDEKMKLLKKAYEGFVYLEEVPEDLNEEYSSALIGGVNSKLRESSKNLKKIETELSEFLEGDFFHKELDQSYFDGFFDSACVRIRSYGINDENAQVERIFAMAETVADSFELEEQKGKYFGNLLEAYAEHTKQWVDDGKGHNSDKLQRLLKLRRLGESYGHDIEFMDVPAKIDEYIDKL